MKKFYGLILSALFISSLSLALSEAVEPFKFSDNIKRIDTVATGVIKSIEVQWKSDPSSSETYGPLELEEFCSKKRTAIGIKIVTFKVEDIALLKQGKSNSLPKGNNSLDVKAISGNVCMSLSKLAGRINKKSLLMLSRIHIDKKGALSARGFEFYSPSSYEGAPAGWIKYESEFLGFIQDAQVWDELKLSFRR